MTFAQRYTEICFSLGCIHWSSLLMIGISSNRWLAMCSRNGSILMKVSQNISSRVDFEKSGASIRNSDTAWKMEEVAIEWSPFYYQLSTSATTTKLLICYDLSHRPEGSFREPSQAIYIPDQYEVLNRSKYVRLFVRLYNFCCKHPPGGKNQAFDFKVIRNTASSCRKIGIEKRL